MDVKESAVDSEVLAGRIREGAWGEFCFTEELNDITHFLTCPSIYLLPLYRSKNNRYLTVLS